MNIVFGIDFGTTYTVVSWEENEKINFLEQNGAINKYLKPTIINGQANLKRLLASQTQESNHAIYEHVKQFFMNINAEISIQLGINDIKQCVITVPARFDDISRNLIKSAAIASGFHVIKLIAEPVAAAIYSVGKKTDGYYIVYDLGGGTFDITLLKFQQNFFQILAIDGIANFGGIDVDQLLVDKFGYSLKEAIHHKHSGNFSAQEYNAIDDLLKPTYKILFDILKNNNLRPRDINQLIFAGGSSRLQMTYKHLEKDFSIAEHLELEADYIVSAGAAVYGANMGKSNSDQVLIDAIPFNLGMETIGDNMEVLIPANTPIPCVQSQLFKSVNNVSVLINILQSPTLEKKDAISLGQFEIKVQAHDSNSAEPFQVQFMFDYDGILSIKIGDNIHFVSAKFNEKNKIDDRLFELFEKLKKVEIKTEAQKDYQNYLNQAKEISLSETALDWLIKRFDELFNVN